MSGVPRWPSVESTVPPLIRCLDLLAFMVQFQLSQCEPCSGQQLASLFGPCFWDYDPVVAGAIKPVDDPAWREDVVQFLQAKVHGFGASMGWLEPPDVLVLLLSRVHTFQLTIIHRNSPFVEQGLRKSGPSSYP